MKETNPLGGIFYSYTYYRPKEKRYSYMTGNDVTYTYGTSGNDKGRLVFVTDGSGSYECHYDKLGNVTDEIRSIALPHNSDEVYRFHMDYTYDSWGRMLSMTYPDGEKITYTYQWGGDLRSMHGVKNSNHRTYIREIRYNPFGQKKQVNYGNGTQAQYSYDALHRLAKLRSHDSLGNLMQKLDYTFDNASNITFIKNSAGVANSLGGGYENKYHYDNLHRLTHSDGGGVAGNYDMDMAYTPSGRIIWKHRNAQSSSVSETVDMYYGYCDKYQPHAVKRMFDYNDGMLYDMRWDEAGNLGQVSMGRPGEMFEKGRFLFWTEDNRMHTAVNGKYYSYYAYDYGGERRLKLVGVNSSVDVNAEYMTAVSTLNEPTLYPSAYMVLTNKGYTKHYYAGTERVAARLGGGGLNALHHVIENDRELQTKADSLFDQCLEQVNSRVLKENDLECIMRNKYAKEEFGHWIEGIPYQMKADVECDHRLFKEMVDSMLTDYHNGEEKEVYFYHSDHLGSASWITDSAGIAVQHLQYLPYGEPYIDQRAAGTTYRERFLFTGKEKDEETGFGYFGARYMDHELTTMWISVDPMANKYPSISPYAYCAWNPMKLVDPDGREIDVSHLPSTYQNRLVSCLSAITGLTLFVKDGKLKYEENMSDYKYGSESARIDLMNAIDDDNHTVLVKFGGENDSKKESGIDENGIAYDSYIQLSSKYHRLASDDKSRYGISNDVSTFGLALSFMHELLHAYCGYDDPSTVENDNTFSPKKVGPPTIKTPIEKTTSFKNGTSVVGRVNEYRKELGFDKRAAYANCLGYGVPFMNSNGVIYWIEK